MQELLSQACCRLVRENQSVEWNGASPMCAISLLIQILDESDIVIFFKCTLNVRLLSRMTLRKRGVVLTRTF